MKPTAARVLVRMSDGQWHSAVDLIEGCHQTSADRRMRELRAMTDVLGLHGRSLYPIERRRIRLASGKASHAYEYRLLPTPTLPPVTTLEGEQLQLMPNGSFSS